MADNQDPRPVGPPPRWLAWHTFSLILVVAAIASAGLLIPRWSRPGAWLATMALLTAFVLIAGQGVSGSWRGALIDERNKLSLSRLQSVSWTILIFSGVYTAAMANVEGHQADPLAIRVPGEVLVLMGIGTVSLAATPLIRSTKTSRAANQEQAARTLGLLTARRGGAGTIGHDGQVVVNLSPRDSRWSDLLTGEEVGDAVDLDLGKVQMLFATIVLLVAYAAALGARFAGVAPRIDALPNMDHGLVALLGISHAGYLTTKAIPKSRAA